MGLYFNPSLYSYNGANFTTGLTETCQVLSNIITYGFSGSGITTTILTPNNPVQIGDYVYGQPLFDNECTPVPDGYYIVDFYTSSAYTILVSGNTVIDLPTCGVDPISLGQPILYFQTFETSGLTPSSPIS